MDFLFSDKFPSGIVKVLEDEGFDNLPALLSTDRHDLDGLKLKKGHTAIVCEATKTLQLQHGEGPLVKQTSVKCLLSTFKLPSLLRTALMLCITTMTTMTIAALT